LTPPTHCRLFWVEGLPGSGKSTVIAQLKDLYGDQLLVFPKTDLASIFVRGLNFDFAKWSHPNYKAMIAVEDLKQSILEGFQSWPEFIIGERCHISTLAYYYVTWQTGIDDGQPFNKVRTYFANRTTVIPENYIFLDVETNISQHRDNWQYSNFWNKNNHSELARTFYKDYFSKIKRSITISSEQSLDVIKDHIVKFINDTTI